MNLEKVTKLIEGDNIPKDLKDSFAELKNDIEVFYSIVDGMRFAQKEYFRKRKTGIDAGEELRESKRLEKHVDEFLLRVKNNLGKQTELGF